MKVQELFKRFKQVEAKYNELDRRFEEDFENEELEAELDACYEDEYYPSMMNLVDEVIKLTGCTIPTAKAMIESKNFTNLMKMQIA